MFKHVSEAEPSSLTNSGLYKCIIYKLFALSFPRLDIDVLTNSFGTAVDRLSWVWPSNPSFLNYRCLKKPFINILKIHDSVFSSLLFL